MSRISTAKAAEMLGVQPRTVRGYIRRKWLSSVTPSGLQGNHERHYLDLGEIEAFKTGGAIAARNYRQQRGGQRPMRIRKGRKKTVAN